MPRWQSNEQTADRCMTTSLKSKLHTEAILNAYLFLRRRNLAKTCFPTGNWRSLKDAYSRHRLISKAERELRRNAGHDCGAIAPNVFSMSLICLYFKMYKPLPSITVYIVFLSFSIASLTARRGHCTKHQLHSIKATFLDQHGPLTGRSAAFEGLDH